MISLAGIGIAGVLILILVVVYSPTGEYTRIRYIPPSPPTPPPPKQEISCFIKGIIKSMKDTPGDWFLDSYRDKMLGHKGTLTWVSRERHISSSRTGVFGEVYCITQNGIHLHTTNLTETAELTPAFLAIFNMAQLIKMMEQDIRDKADIVRRDNMRKEFEVLGCPPTGTTVS